MRVSERATGDGNASSLVIDEPAATNEAGGHQEEAMLERWLAFGLVVGGLVWLSVNARDDEAAASAPEPPELDEPVGAPEPEREPDAPLDEEPERDDEPPKPEKGRKRGLLPIVGG